MSASSRKWMMPRQHRTKKPPPRGLFCCSRERHPPFGLAKPEMQFLESVCSAMPSPVNLRAFTSMITPLLIGIKDDGIFDRGEAFVIPPDARRKHMAIFGATGAGKSTLLRNMIATDIAAGAGVTVVDPHGGLVDDILENHIPRSRTNDVIHFDPKDQARTLALNILEPPRPEQRGLVVSNAVSIFHRLWAESWGPRMEDILRNSLYALVEQPRPVSLLALPKLLTDTDYRAAMLARVTTPSVIDFFRNTFDRWTPAFREEAISPVLNKCRAFLTDPMLRAVIGQARSSFDFRWIMDNGKILRKSKLERAWPMTVSISAGSWTTGRSCSAISRRGRSARTTRSSWGRSSSSKKNWRRSPGMTFRRKTGSRTSSTPKRRRTSSATSLLSCRRPGSTA